MKKLLIFIVITMLGCPVTLLARHTLSVIPVPQVVEMQKGHFSFQKGFTAIGNLKKEDARILGDYLRSLPYRFNDDLEDRNADVAVASDEKCLFLTIVPSLPFTASLSGTSSGDSSKEAYSLTVTPKEIRIKALSGAGLFYGLQTLTQMISPKGEVPACTILDFPRFGYRGVMLDVSRHFFSKQFVKKQMDAMAHYKLNRLHLHLTDAAGWRIEIKKYSRLTQFAAWRSFPTWKKWWNNGREYREEGTPGAYGGYYTQEDIRDLVAYARQRYITIIPEIEMPAHSEEVLTAYPELSCTHEPYKQADFCVGNEKTFRFLEDVLTEVMALFPSKYIHIGGDEAAKTSWKMCPLCQQRIKDEHLDGVNGLQSYLIQRIEKFLNAHGRQAIGWDEILDGGLAPNATVMSWRGTEGGLKAMQMGHPAIMSPGAYCYIDSYQDAPPSQPEAIGGYLPLEKVYSYNPVPDTITAAQAALLMGVQANLWAEYVPTPEHSEFMLYPRVLALAEVGWSNPAMKDYKDFHRRALTAVADLQQKGYHPFDLKNEYGQRPEYLRPVKHKALGKKVIYGTEAMYYPTYTAGGDKALTDGLRGGWTNNDGRWQGFIQRNGVDVVVDMGKITTVKSISAEFMQVTGPEIFFPRKVTISLSDDGKHFRPVKIMTNSFSDNGRVEFREFSWEGKLKGRYIRYQAERSEKGGFLFTDEIVVK